MTSESQLNPYRCDQCGAANVVAAPVLYQEGTRAYSGVFYSGVTQSYAAQAVAPPDRRRYLRPILLWGFGVVFAFIWGWAGLTAVEHHPNSISTLDRPIAFLAILAIGCVLGMAFSFRRIARYNREIYPRLLRNWEHTFICRRCGRSFVIPSSLVPPQMDR